MGDLKRVFVFGAGFSKPAGMPLANELVDLCSARIPVGEMRDWIEHLRDRLTWLSTAPHGREPFKLSIEEVFHYAHFDVEVHRLLQQLVPVGRTDGETPWDTAEHIESWLRDLEEAMCDVISERENKADLLPITRWAEAVTHNDAVITFNYDTLVERALLQLGQCWSHGFVGEADEGIPVFKLHGSIDWIVVHRSQVPGKLDLLFDKRNDNRTDRDSGHIEDDCRLWRCRSAEQRCKWIQGRHLQLGKEGEVDRLHWRKVGIAGLGAYKLLHEVPGLGLTWVHAMKALHQADVAIVVGFSLSEFDAMAQLQFAEVAKDRIGQHPLRVVVVDPFLDDAGERRFARVFRTENVHVQRERHEAIDWSSIS